jgi:predicted DNA-binding WGR domain protein
MSQKESLDKVGKFIVETLHDEALSRFERLAQGKSKAPGQRALQDALKTLTPEQQAVVRDVVEACTNAAIHRFLFGLVENAEMDDDMQLVVDGESAVKLSDGLHGEMFGDEGWRARFSEYAEKNEADEEVEWKREGRYFEGLVDGEMKFCHAVVKGSMLMTRWGVAGQIEDCKEKEKEFESAEQALADMERQIATRLKSGYKETEPGGKL